MTTYAFFFCLSHGEGLMFGVIPSALLIGMLNTRVCTKTLTQARCPEWPFQVTALLIFKEGGVRLDVDSDGGLS